jgi:DNA processing protein
VPPSAGDSDVLPPPASALFDPVASPDEEPDDEIWVRLARADLSARRLRRLLDHYGSPQAALGATDRELRALGLGDAVIERFLASANDPLKSELSRVRSLGIKIIPYVHPDYPAPLAEIYDPPVVLFVRGTLTPADAFAVAIVGSRRATPYGKSVAERLGRELAEVGLTVVSGLARGVDTAAHQGVLAAGGRTIGVLGCGVDIAYPASNRGLIDRMIGSGAVVSEFAPGITPDAWRFPARNRIISGLSKGIVVCESAINSGALITVNYALEQGREVFAVPGSVETGLNSGCHRLLREGAGLVETAKDVLESLGMGEIRAKARADPAVSLSDDERDLLELIGFTQKRADDLIEESGIPASRVNAALTMLELHGKLRKLAGGLYVRTSLV